MDHLYNKVKEQLLAAGYSVPAADTIIAKQNSSSPASAALELAKHNVLYHDAFAFYSQSNNRPIPTKAHRTNPLFFILVGFFLCAVGIIPCIMYFMGRPQLSITTWGGFLFFGVSFFLKGLVGWLKH